MDRKLTI